MGNAVMADSISYLPEFKAWYSVIGDTLAEVDLSKLLVYMIDTVDAVRHSVSRLPVRCAGLQRDAAGANGRRPAQAVKNSHRAASLQRYGVGNFRSLESIGFEDVKMKKGIAGGYDHWAKFGLDITSSGVELTEQTFTDITQMVKEYKRAVCVLKISPSPCWWKIRSPSATTKHTSGPPLKLTTSWYCPAL